MPLGAFGCFWVWVPLGLGTFGCFWVWVPLGAAGCMSRRVHVSPGAASPGAVSLGAVSLGAASLGDNGSSPCFLCS